jgi:hypothetical protein
MMQGSRIGVPAFSHHPLPPVSAPYLCTLGKLAPAPGCLQLSSHEGFADAMFAADGYNITASLCNILEPKVLTIIICFMLNAKRMLGRNLWD